MKTRYYFLTAAMLFWYMAFSQGFTVMQNGPNLNVSRYGHAAVNLPNGDVLAIGGHTTGFLTTNTAEIYDVASDSWTLYNITNPHDMLAMAKMSNGNYLFMGGCSSDYGVGQSTVTTIFDPVTKTFSVGPSMITARTNATAVRVASGDILVVGNWYNTGNAELYDAASGQFVAVGAPPTERALALLLPADDGTAYIVGGTGNYGGSYFNAVEKYDPATNLITTHSPEIFPNETGWSTLWSASMPLIEEMRLSDGNYVFLVFKTDNGVTSYRIGQFNPATKVFSILQTTPAIPDYTGTNGFAASASIMVDAATDYIYLNVVKNSTFHEERMYTVDATNGILSIPTGETAFPYYVYTGSKAWVNGGIMYTGGTNDGSNFDVSDEVRILSPSNSFGVEEVNRKEVLRVYPNPVNSQMFTIVLPFEGQKTVYVYDLAGNTVRNIVVTSDEETVFINRNDLPPGVYVIEVLSRVEVYRTKIILQ